jgi:pentatricopeptide repeat protein
MLPCRAPVHGCAARNICVRMHVITSVPSVHECATQQQQQRQRVQPEVLYQIADVYAAKGDVKRAGKLLRRTHDAVGAEPGVLARLAVMAIEQHSDRDEAAALYQQSYEELPSVDVLAMLCTQLVHDERYGAAAARFGEAARVQPGEPKWRLMAASCHVRAGDVERAFEMYEQARRRRRAARHWLFSALLNPLIHCCRNAVASRHVPIP